MGKAKPTLAPSLVPGWRCEVREEKKNQNHSRTAMLNFELLKSEEEGEGKQRERVTKLCDGNAVG